METKTPEQLFEERFDKSYWQDKHHKSGKNFDYYDMLDFAELYASQFQSRIKELEEAVQFIIDAHGLKITDAIVEQLQKALLTTKQEKE